MRVHDDDDAGDAWRDDSFDEDPDHRDISDEDSVRCVHCGRYIHADADICPYCRMWQTDEVRDSGKPLWFVLTVILCVAAISGALAVGIALMYGWRPWIK
jgi:RNA polymerase subunit RPABC4/transcription elongation factor Spt4